MYYLWLCHFKGLHPSGAPANFEALALIPAGNSPGQIASWGNLSECS